MALYFRQIDAGMIFYDRKYSESDALSLGRKILWHCIGIQGAVVVSGLVCNFFIEKSCK